MSFYLLSVSFLSSAQQISLLTEIYKKEAYENDKCTDTNYWLLSIDTKTKYYTCTCKICGDTTTPIPVMHVII